MILGISNGDSFEDARKAFKRQMHRLHPDRYPHDIAAQKKASERFSQLKICFKCVEEHYALYGEMPFIDDFVDHPAERNSSIQAQEEAKANIKKEIEAVAERNQQEEEILRQASSLNTDSSPIYIAESKTNSRAKEKTSSAGEIGAGLFVIGILAYFVLHPPTVKFWVKDKTKPTNDDIHLNDADQQNLLEAQSGPKDYFYEEQLKTKALLSKTQQRLLETASGKTFTFGSSYKDVARIHGPPDKSENQIWYYDNSQVMFEDGIVIDWKSDASYPLATRLR